MNIRIGLAENNSFFRGRISFVLSQVPDFEMHIIASNGKELVDELAFTDVDVVLLDVMMPVMDGIKAAGAIKKRYPHIRVMAISVNSQECNINAMCDAGATGYVLKDVEARLLENAVRTVFKGGDFYSAMLFHDFLWIK